MYRSRLFGWCKRKIKSTKNKIYIDQCLERHVARVRCRGIAEEMKTSAQRETVNRSHGGINCEFMRICVYMLTIDRIRIDWKCRLLSHSSATSIHFVLINSDLPGFHFYTVGTHVNESANECHNHNIIMLIAYGVIWRIWFLQMTYILQWGFEIKKVYYKVFRSSINLFYKFSINFYKFLFYFFLNYPHSAAWD